MSNFLEDKIRERIKLREKRYDFERRMRRKRSEEMEVLEEVFDKPTLMALYTLLNKGYLKEIFGAVKAGKESKIYWGKSMKGEDLAVKIYLTVSSEFRKGILQYINGDPRFKRIDKSTRALIYRWALKEFENLKLMEEAGVRVPRRVAVEKNVLIMEFIGEDGTPAPLLKEATLQNPRRIFDTIIEGVKRLYRGPGLVHGDLSEYNIMIWEDAPVFFDVSQAVKLDHPMATIFLRRDLNNIYGFFSRMDIEIPPIEDLYRRVVGDDAEQV
ncbi:MAG: serine protein kinase RIO [Candidatus Bathyarchaeia archaeon]